MMIGALSKATKCNIETIRYYERIGVIPKPPRTAGGHRDYDTPHLKRLNFVRRSRELGFSLGEIRQMLRLVDGGDVTCDQVHDMALGHLSDVRAKIADLKRMERTLKDTAARCEGGKTPDCPIIESLFDGKST
ncbi:MAG: helix-turn-helix domain-containing protein [Rhodospirillales bacterium]|nr:helix-turn-helix domain-containing protein [Rhodospirillales bacterium]